MNNKPVLITILNYKNPEDTLLCLRSLRKHIPRELADIFLVENSPQPSGAGKELTDFYQIVPNKGYSHGNNVGLRMAYKKGYRYTLILNNDTLCDYNFLESLIHAIEANKADAVSPKIIHCKIENHTLHKINKLAYAGAFTPSKLEHWYPRGVFGDTPATMYAQNESCDWLSGACLLLRTEVLSLVGLFDEDYFLYYEDVDWSLRAKQRGASLWYIGNEIIYHQHSKSTSEVKAFYYPRAFLIFIHKHFPNQLKLALKRFVHHYIFPHLRQHDFRSLRNDVRVLFSVIKYTITSRKVDNNTDKPTFHDHPKLDGIKQNG